MKKELSISFEEIFQWASQDPTFNLSWNTCVRIFFGKDGILNYHSYNRMSRDEIDQHLNRIDLLHSEYNDKYLANDILSKFMHLNKLKHIIILN